MNAHGMGFKYIIIVVIIIIIIIIIKLLLCELYNIYTPCMISGFRREVADSCTLLGYYAESNGNFLRTFRDNIGPILRVQEFLGMGPIGCTEKSVRNCHYSLRNNPDERSSLPNTLLKQT